MMLRFAGGAGRRAGALALTLLLAACTMTDKADDAAATGNPITGEAISVTSLDAPTAAAAPGPAAPDQPPPPRPAASAGEDAIAADGTKADAAAADAAAPAEIDEQAQDAPAANAAAAPPEEPPPPPLSPEERACIKKGGEWIGAGKSGAHACVQPTRDGGKRCTRESQCEGFCLARSGTCAPVKPLFGCNDILQDNGVMVTLCID